MAESFRAVPISANDTPYGERRKPARNHCHQCGGEKDLRRIRMAYPQINAAGETTKYAGYCGVCRLRDRLVGQLLRGEITDAQRIATLNAYTGGDWT